MPEPTSIDSYRQAHESGLIGQRQLEVLAFVIANEPCSQGDVSRHFADASSSYQPRFRELEDSGLIEQRGNQARSGNRPRRQSLCRYRQDSYRASMRRKRRKFRATLEPAGDGLFRVTCTPAFEIERSVRRIEFTCFGSLSMSPTYTAPGDQFYHADCRDVSYQCCAPADAVLTDPPYGIAHEVDYDRFTGGKRPSRDFKKPNAADDGPFDPAPWLAFPKGHSVWGQLTF